MPDRVEFKKLVEDLVERVERDLDAKRGPDDKRAPDDAEWITKRYPKKMRDVDGTVYDVLFLVLQKGAVRLSLDPVGYDIPGAEAAVDLYLMPTYDPLATFYSENGYWYVHSSYLPESAAGGSVEEERRAPLSRDALNQVMEAIAEHAVPSL